MSLLATVDSIPSKTKAQAAVVSTTTKTPIKDIALVTDTGRIPQNAIQCRTAILLISAKKGKAPSPRAEAWLNRWTTPGLDATTCRCHNCGGVRYTDWHQIDLIRKTRSMSYAK